MATTVNNTTVNSRITIIFDADGSLNGDGPAKGTGNTESDVYLDNITYLNIRSHTEINANVHALQWDATTNTGQLEYIDNRENEPLTSFPQWATNVVIRCEAQDAWQTSYDANVAEQFTAWQTANPDANTETFVANTTQATSVADTERTNYLSAHSITY
tara:strand:+ start:628 stop:1104 length:477 start_codon:yes stop_codon:yes gene_type:complete